MWGRWNILISTNRFRSFYIQVDRSYTCIHNKYLPRGINKMATKWLTALSVHGLESHASLYTFVSESIKKCMICLKQIWAEKQIKVYLPILKRTYTSKSPLYLPSYLAPAVTIMSCNCRPLLRSGLRVSRVSVPQWHYFLSKGIHNVMKVYAKFKFFLLPWNLI